MEIFKQFDTYSLKAQVFPALVAGLPTLALLFVIVPWDHFGISHAIAAVMGAVLLFAFADMARHRGRVVQAKLGTGATPEQWYRGNADLPEVSKDTFRDYMARQLKQAAPTVEIEQTDPARANDFYLGANAWLRDRTRDKRTFSLLFGENVTYGFRRNLLGLKLVGLVLNLLVLIFCCSILWFRPPYFTALPNLDEKLTFIIAAVLFHSAYLVFAVGKAAVRDASRAYGRQLILSTEALMKKGPAVRKGAKASDASGALR